MPLTDTEIKKITTTYLQLLNQQQFIIDEVDYSILEKHKPMLQMLATVGNSSVSVFDALEKKHVFYSSNFGNLLGYFFDKKIYNEQEYMDAKIHPEDHLELMKNGISILKLFYKFSIDEKNNHKLINEYRILNNYNSYVKVIEQHQILELDKYGNIWLSLSIVDVSPNQETNEGLKSQLINFRTGQIIPFLKIDDEPNVVLTQREIQILKLVKYGFLSKEISSKLSISVHTVNTHRQRFLEKLGANNSMEAVVYASKLGLL